MKNKLILLLFLLLIFPFQYSYSEVNKVGLICSCKIHCKDLEGIGFIKFRKYHFTSDGISSLGVWIEKNEVIETNFIMGQNDNILKDIFEHFKYPIQTTKDYISWENEEIKLFSIDEGIGSFRIINHINREKLTLLRSENFIENNKVVDSISYEIVYQCSSPISSKREYEKELNKLQKKYQSEYNEVLKKNKI